MTVLALAGAITLVLAASLAVKNMKSSDSKVRGLCGSGLRRDGDELGLWRILEKSWQVRNKGHSPSIEQEYRTRNI